jgi:hypothetical protein
VDVPIGSSPSCHLRSDAEIAVGSDRKLARDPITANLFETNDLSAKLEMMMRG